MNHPARVLIVAIVIAVLGLGAWNWRDAWWPRRPSPAASAPVSTPAPAPMPAPPDAAASVAGSPPPIRHPIEAASAPPVPEPAPATLDSALARLFGAELMATLLQSDDFARRVVATVDNLGREKAPARLWPLHPPAGRFTARRQGEGSAGGEVIAADNFVRYARHMAFVENADLAQVVALYKRFYPQFQQAYEELGYPGRHFNDRLVEVIDLLLATPEAREPVPVRLPAIQGPIQPQRPWLLYEFAEPERQAMAAGPQLMMRMGPENQRRLKVRLILLRKLLTR
ncbi:MAG: DUF3014 domain-containing protein [Burkholderiales bacterium]|nr:DUF3014 domain-containing protein [Burkholderiales bacterium]